MRYLFLALPVATLSACIAPAPQPTSDAAVLAQPFTMPMDPGLIRCDQLSNTAALDAATDWTLGRARAAVLAGRLSAVPDTLSVSGALSAYCQSNRNDVLRNAAIAVVGV
ncbi:hypothetical protein Q4555_02800 [Octadecabacter sp. 1_MG-2023]|uniref:hypothetical protein n=1 Tax=unclassified Octadecabacter TaxID=196158 RepID=UPI001C09201E|nr:MULTISPECIES: hypothetical protein [unclassified Octadecabacter]MBU2992968.1 hypothetical protein [Octadecabacter sp. B2R22]MDO6733580.1 hypothetical protein [Octadecabacter sp. 1_MG-2023]